MPSDLGGSISRAIRLRSRFLNPGKAGVRRVDRAALSWLICAPSGPAEEDEVDGNDRETRRPQPWLARDDREGGKLTAYKKSVEER